MGRAVTLLGILGLVVLMVMAPMGSTPAQQSACRVEPSQGAASPQGTVTRMQVMNTGGECVIANYGLPVERGNPAKHTPAQGYVGEDGFEYEAFARGRTNQPDPPQGAGQGSRHRPLSE